jgi:hypothetical protein
MLRNPGGGVQVPVVAAVVVLVPLAEAGLLAMQEEVEGAAAAVVMVVLVWLRSLEGEVMPLCIQGHRYYRR